MKTTSTTKTEPSIFNKRAVETVIRIVALRQAATLAQNLFNTTYDGG